ncbi:MAG: hypothetical protein JWO64_2844 [Hyphomicrobiales bacterium]|nr:hypothetical protein [Hyphomicrobiales bacterium]
MPVAHRTWRRPFWTTGAFAQNGAAFARLQETPATTTLAPPLILGLVANYTAAQLAPFVKSLRASGYKGQVVFLTANLSDDTHAFLNDAGVEALSFDPALYAPYHIQNARWFFYLDYLMSRLRDGSLPRQIMFTDVRDVVFQDDPFRGRAGGLEIFYENDQPRLGQCAVNAKWLRTCFGELVARELAAFNISCSGTVIGDGPSALHYLIQMWNVLALLSDEAAASIADQAVHNFVVHRGLVEDVRHRRNGDHIYTLHYVGQQAVLIDGEGVICAPGDGICPVVHQYDRHPALAEAVRAKYPLQPRVEEQAA